MGSLLLPERMALLQRLAGDDYCRRVLLSPPLTPFVGVAHNFGSRTWYSTNAELLQGLGESLTSAHAWTRGDQPAIVPNPEILGDPDILADGGKIENAIGTDEMRNGFPIACFTPETPLDPTWEIAASFSVCSLQFFYATIIKWLYVGDIESIKVAFRLLLGPDVNVHWHPGTATLPDCVIVTMPTFSIVCIDGTSTFQQFAMQAFSFIVGPENIGIFSTWRFWYDSASFVLSLFDDDGVDPDQPIFLSGHSFGGVVATIMAARLRAFDPDRQIRYCTFGDPRPGDVRFQRLLESIPGISLANEEDIVTGIPPDEDEIFPVAIFMGIAGLLVWSRWKQEPNRARQDKFGNLQFNLSPIIDAPLLIHMTTQILTHQPFDIVTAHFIAEYRRRIEVRCPNPEWPVSDILWKWLKGDLFAFGSIGLATPFVTRGHVGLPGHYRPGGSVELASTTANPYGAIVLWMPPPPPPNCPCCAEFASPIEFHVLISAPGYAFDGTSVAVFLFPISGGCGWFGTDTTGSMNTGFDVFSTTTLGEGNLQILWDANDGVDNWDTGGSFVDVILPNCVPWYWSVHTEIFLNGVATGDLVTFTVESVP